MPFFQPLGAQDHPLQPAAQLRRVYQVKIARRQHAEHPETDIGRRGAVRHGVDRRLLNVVRRQPVISPSGIFLEKTPHPGGTALNILPFAFGEPRRLPAALSCRQRSRRQRQQKQHTVQPQQRKRRKHQRGAKQSGKGIAPDISRKAAVARAVRRRHPLQQPLFADKAAPESAYDRIGGDRGRHREQHKGEQRAQQAFGRLGDDVGEVAPCQHKQPAVDERDHRRDERHRGRRQHRRHSQRICGAPLPGKRQRRRDRYTHQRQHRRQLPAQIVKQLVPCKHGQLPAREQEYILPVAPYPAVQPCVPRGRVGRKALLQLHPREKRRPQIFALDHVVTQHPLSRKPPLHHLQKGPDVDDALSAEQRRAERVLIQLLCAQLIRRYAAAARHQPGKQRASGAVQPHRHFRHDNAAAFGHYPFHGIDHRKIQRVHCRSDQLGGGIEQQIRVGIQHDHPLFAAQSAPVRHYPAPRRASACNISRKLGYSAALALPPAIALLRPGIAPLAHKCRERPLKFGVQPGDRP